MKRKIVVSILWTSVFGADPCQKLCALDPDSTCRTTLLSFSVGGGTCFGYYHKEGGRFCYSVSDDDLNCPRTGGPVLVEDAERFVAMLRRGPSPISASSPINIPDGTLSDLLKNIFSLASAEEQNHRAIAVVNHVREALSEPVFNERGVRIINHSAERWFKLGGAALYPLVREVSPWRSLAGKLIFQAYVDLVTGLSLQGKQVGRFLQISGFNWMCENQPHKLLWLVTHDVHEWSERDIITFSGKQYIRNIKLFDYCPKIFAKDSSARSLLHMDRVHRALFVSQSNDQYSYNFLTLYVYRRTVIKSSFEQLVTSDPGPRSHLDVRFHSESGYGHGTIKDWFSLVSDRMVGMFFQIDEVSSAHYLKSTNMNRSNWNLEMVSLGNIIALSLRERVPIALNLPLTYYARILNTEVMLSDIESDDPALYESYMDILSRDLNEMPIIEMEFGIETVGLTQENKREMIEKKLNWPPLNSYEIEMIDRIREGFTSVSMSHYINHDRMLTPSVLRDVTAGQQLSIDKLKETVQFESGYDDSSDQIIWLFKMLESFDAIQLQDFLKFITALPRVPIGGLSRLEIPLSVRKVPYVEGILPSARTCFNEFRLPEYPSEEELREAYLEAVAQALTIED